MERRPRTRQHMYQIIDAHLLRLTLTKLYSSAYSFPPTKHSYLQLLRLCKRREINISDAKVSEALCGAPPLPQTRRHMHQITEARLVHLTLTQIHSSVSSFSQRIMVYKAQEICRNAPTWK